MRTTRALAAVRRRGRRRGARRPDSAGGVGSPPSNIVALPSVIARGGQLTVTVDGCPGGGTHDLARVPERD